MTRRKSNPQTRAEEAGLSAKVLAHKARRFSDQTRQHIQQIAYDWNELCGFVDSAATDLDRALDAFDETMKEAFEYINQPPEEF